MRYMLTREDIDGLPACRSPYQEHVWARGTSTLYCQRCTMVIDFRENGKPMLDAPAEQEGTSR